MARILIVDDEANIRRILAVLMIEDGHAVFEASGVREAVSLLGSTALDLVITDQKMQDGEGLEVLVAAREADPTLPVVVLTAFASVELAVESMRRGAFDFVTKPFLPEVVRATVRRACERADLLRENQRLKSEVRRLGPSGEILGESAAIREVRETIARVAPAGSTVLIQGETGTGKELAARAIHDMSPRSAEPFVAVNCAAFPETLLESELFGHERGAFTGADRARQGLFETAHRGTLLLDEAGDMSASLQAKLLRVLSDGKVVRVGSTASRTVDVRIIVATHRDLKQRVREGLFREDLYYRVAVVPLMIPPLRERAADLPVLIESLLERLARDLKVPRKSIRREAVEKLSRYRFPGNVRELRNLLERAYILGRGESFGPEDFPLDFEGIEATKESPAPDADPTEAWLGAMAGQLDLRATIEQLERGLLARALKAADGVQAEAARSLGISRSDMAYKLRKHGIVEEF
jgi:DNA-binding NtrC family response regulator